MNRKELVEGIVDGLKDKTAYDIYVGELQDRLAEAIDSRIYDELMKQ